MRCRGCGKEIPEDVIYGDSFDCPYCGHRYYKRAPQSNRQSQRSAGSHQRYVQPQPKKQPNEEFPLRIPRLVVSILAIVLFLIVMNQSRLVGVVNAIEGNTSDASGGGGMMLSFMLLIGGIVGIVGLKNVKAVLVTGVLFAVGALIGFMSLGTFGDLIVWSILALGFAALFLYTYWRIKPVKSKPTRR